MKKKTDSDYYEKSFLVHFSDIKEPTRLYDWTTKVLGKKQA